MTTTLTEREIRVLEKGEISCSDVTALLGSYVDRELLPELHEKVAAHIEECPECREGETRYREVIALAKSIAAPKVSEDMHRRLRAVLSAKLGISLTIH